MLEVVTSTDPFVGFMVYTSQNVFEMSVTMSFSMSLSQLLRTIGTGPLPHVRLHPKVLSVIEEITV